MFTVCLKNTVLDGSALGRWPHTSYWLLRDKAMRHIIDFFFKDVIFLDQQTILEIKESHFPLSLF